MKYSQVSSGRLAMIRKRSTTRELKRPPWYRSSPREVHQTSNALRVEGGATRLGSSILAEKSRSSTKNICLSKNDLGNIVNRTDLERSWPSGDDASTESELSRSKFASGIKVPDSVLGITPRRETDSTFGIMRRNRWMLSRASGLRMMYKSIVRSETAGNEMREMMSYAKDQRTFQTTGRMLLTRVFTDKLPVNFKLLSVFVDRDSSAKSCIFFSSLLE